MSRYLPVRKGFTMNALARSLGRSTLASLVVGLLMNAASGLRAAEPAKGPAPKDIPAKAAADASAAAEASAPATSKPALNAPLDMEQKRVADRYANLEKAMNRMAEVIGQTDPKQAALLRQAFAESRQRLLDDRFIELVSQLKKDQ